MKRLFILATAAIVALASCAKTEVVYTGAPDQIAFKNYSNVMTKAALTTDLGVFANKSADDGVYLDNAEFDVADGVWTNPGAFWPYDGTLDFTVYAPYKAGTTYSDNVLTMTGVTAVDALYYGVERYTGKQKDVNPLPVALNHVSAKITVNLNPATVYTVNSLSLSAVKTGTVTVNYETPAVTAAGTPETVTFAMDDTDDENDGDQLAPVYVLPGSQTAFTINFTQDNGENDVTYEKTIDLSAESAKWNANTAYTYNISIAGPDQIRISATVNEYSPGATTALDEEDMN